MSSQAGSDISVSMSSARDFEMVAAQTNDPIEILGDRIGVLVEYFSPDAQARIRDSLKQDKLRAEHLSKMESALRESGDVVAVQRIVGKSRDLCHSSMSQVLPMRRHINDIAEALNELSKSEVFANEVARLEVINEIKESSGKAFQSAADGKTKIESFALELRSVQESYMQKKLESEQDAKKSEQDAKQQMKLAALHGTAAFAHGSGGGVTGAATAGGAGVGCLAAANGASWIAGVPYIGAALTTSTTTTVSAGGISGFFGATTTSTAVMFNPVGLAVGTGLCAIFGIISISQIIRARHHSNLKSLALDNKADAETRTTQSQAVATQSQKMSETTMEMMEGADFH